MKIAEEMNKEARDELQDNYDNIDWTKSNYKLVKAKKRTKSPSYG